MAWQISRTVSGPAEAEEQVLFLHKLYQRGLIDRRIWTVMVDQYHSDWHINDDLCDALNKEIMDDAYTDPYS